MRLLDEIDGDADFEDDDREFNLAETGLADRSALDEFTVDAQFPARIVTAPDGLLLEIAGSGALSNCVGFAPKRRFPRRPPTQKSNSAR